MARQSEREICLCALKGTIDTIARKWSLFVLNVIGNNGRLRFNELMDHLKTISPTSLTETLDKLTQLGLVRREAYGEIPPRVEYSLTVEGEDLRKAIIPLLLWVAKRDPVRAADPGCPVFARVSLSPS